jgi:exodeoxyribonuclease VII small subunit
MAKQDQDQAHETSEQTAGSSFEESLNELERIVQQMESGELSLEQSLEAFERGIRLTRACQQALSKAEQKVQALTEHDGEVSLTAFDPTDDEDDRES